MHTFINGSATFYREMQLMRETEFESVLGTHAKTGGTDRYTQIH